MDIQDFHLYSIRLDNSHNEVVEDDIMNWCATAHIKYYMFAREHKEDGTPHYQGVLMCEEEITEKKARCLRQQIIRNLIHKVKGKQNYSFKKARKPESLIKYCNDKEELGVITNIPAEKRALIAKWQIQEKKGEKIAKKKALLLKALEDLKKSTTTREQFFHRSIIAYQEIYDNLPRASQVEYWVYKYASSDDQRADMRIQKYKFIHQSIAYNNQKETEEYLTQYATGYENEKISFDVKEKY